MLKINTYIKHFITLLYYRGSLLGTMFLTLKSKALELCLLRPQDSLTPSAVSGTEELALCRQRPGGVARRLQRRRRGPGNRIARALHRQPFSTAGPNAGRLLVQVFMPRWRSNFHTLERKETIIEHSIFDDRSPAGTFSCPL